MPDKNLQGFANLCFANTTSYSIPQHRPAIALQSQNSVGEFRLSVENSRHESPLRGLQNANAVCRHVNRATVKPFEYTC
jgi:hypothetical protein